MIKSAPCRDKLRKCVTENTINTILLTQDNVHMNIHVYFFSNKGNKKSNKNLAKFICWYDVEKKQIKKFLLHVDCTDENTEKIMDSIMHSLKCTSPQALK